jgi:uncharacterized damage-inducible protein DinB
MAAYNEWMNAKVYEAAGKLPDEALSADRKAFFGSILGTLNHLAVGDTIWLKRFAAHPAGYAALEPIREFPDPARLDQLLFSDIRSLFEYRKRLDRIIIEWTAAIAEADLDHILNYKNMQGIAVGRRFFDLLMHFFNHQTHHRGQVTTLLSQAGADIGVSDLLALIPNHSTV